MARGAKTEAQVDLKVNGEAAGKTYKELVAVNKQLNAELAKLPVGSDEFNKKAQEVAKSEQALAKYKEEVNKARQAQGQLGDAAQKAKGDLLSLSPVGGVVNNITDGFNSAKSATQGVIGKFGLLKGAIAATGLGVLVLLLGSLVQWFIQTDEGATMLDGVMRSLTATFQVLMKAIRDFATGDFDAFDNLGEKIGNAAKEGYKLAQVFDDLDERSRGMAEADAEAALAVDRLLLQAKNVSTSYQDRIKLLEQASSIESKQHEKRMQYARDYLAAVDAEIALAKKSGTVSDELAKKRSDANVALMNLQRESISLQEKIANREAALQEKIEAEQEKRRERLRKEREKREAEELKKQEELEKAKIDAEKRFQDLRLALIPNEFDRKRAARQAAFDQEMEDLRQKGVQRADLELALKTKLDQDLQAIEEERKKREAETKDKDLKERLAAEQEQEEAARLDIEAKFEQLLISEAAKEQLLYDVKRSGIVARQAALAEAGKQESNEYKALRNELIKTDNEHQKKLLENQKRTAEAERLVRSQQNQFMKDSLNFTVELLSQDEQSRKENAEAIKAFTMASILVKGAEEIQGIWRNANLNPTNAIVPGWAQAWAGAQTVFASARMFSALRRVENTKYSTGGVLGSFAMGGTIHPKGGVPAGASHTQGGILLVERATGQVRGEMEGGEPIMILSKRLYSNNKHIVDPLLRSSLYEGGRRIFQDGGVVSSTGQAVSVGVASGSADTSEIAIRTLNEMILLRQAFEAIPTKLRAYVETEQVIEALQEASDIEAEARV